MFGVAFECVEVQFEQVFDVHEQALIGLFDCVGEVGRDLLRGLFGRVEAGGRLGRERFGRGGQAWKVGFSGRRGGLFAGEEGVAFFGWGQVRTVQTFRLLDGELRVDIASALQLLQR